MAFPDKQFDAVLDIGCLHMISDSRKRQAAFAEMARVLRPDGIVCGRALTPRERQLALGATLQIQINRIFF